MEAYYRARAGEYDRFYEVSEYQDDLAALRAWLVPHVAGRAVLEVAAGTGYWTAVAAPHVREIVATDLNAEPLALARRRRLGSRVSFIQADAYALPDLGGPFEVGMAHLWWSHVERRRRGDFLAHLASRLCPGATLLMLDQRFRRGRAIPASRRTAAGDRRELRTLENGETYEVVKNYPGPAQLRASLTAACSDIQVVELENFWALSARFRPEAAR